MFLIDNITSLDSYRKYIAIFGGQLAEILSKEPQLTFDANGAIENYLGASVIRGNFYNLLLEIPKDASLDLRSTARDNFFTASLGI